MNPRLLPKLRRSTHSKKNKSSKSIAYYSERFSTSEPNIPHTSESSDQSGVFFIPPQQQQQQQQRPLSLASSQQTPLPRLSFAFSTRSEVSSHVVDITKPSPALDSDLLPTTPPDADFDAAFTITPRSSKPRRHLPSTVFHPPETTYQGPPQRCPLLPPTAAQAFALLSDHDILAMFFKSDSATMLRKSIRDFLDTDDVARLAFLSAVEEYRAASPIQRKSKALFISSVYLLPTATAPIHCEATAVLETIETQFNLRQFDDATLFDELATRVITLLLHANGFRRWRALRTLESGYSSAYPIGREWNFRHCYFRTLPYFALPPLPCPFDAEYHPNHALWAINMACLVYLEPPEIFPILAEFWGMDFFEFIEGAATGTQAMVAGNRDVTFISFRGTESAEDWKTNQDYKLVPLFEKSSDESRRGSFLQKRAPKASKSEPLTGSFSPLTPEEVSFQKLSNETMVHRGFRTAFMSVSKQVDRIIAARRAENPSTLIYITGHSLGGALATLCLTHFLCRSDPIPVHGTYTFGQPRVGNSAFEKRLANAAQGFGALFRIVNSSDIVAKLPPGTFGFKHYGIPILLTSQKELITRPDKDTFKAESAGVGGGLVNHTKNEYLACYDMLRYSNRFQYLPAAAKGLFTIKSTRGIDVDAAQLIIKSHGLSWKAEIASIERHAKAEEVLLTFQIPEIYPSDDFTIELWDRPGKQCLGAAIVGLDNFDDQPDQRIPLVPRPGCDDHVSSLAAVILDSRYFPIPAAPPLIPEEIDDLNAGHRSLRLTVHALRNSPFIVQEPNNWTVVLVRHHFHEWASPKLFPLTALNHTLTLPRVALNDYLHLEFYSIGAAGTDFIFIGRVCFEVSHGFFDFRVAAFPLQEPLDPKPGAVYHVQGDALLSFEFQRLPIIPPAAVRPVATATITVHRQVDVPVLDGRDDQDRQFVIRASAVSQPWSFVSPKLTHSPAAAAWNFSFVVPKMSVSSPVEIELLEHVGGDKFESQGRALLQCPSLHEDIVSEHFSLSGGKRVGKHWTAEEAVPLGLAATPLVTAPFRPIKGALLLSAEFKPCADVVRRTAGLATGKMRIFKVSVRTPRFLREMGVPQKVSLAISPETTVQAAIDIILQRLTKGLHESRAQLLQTLQSFVLAVLSWDDQTQVLPADTLLWNLLTTTRLVFIEGSTLSPGTTALSASAHIKRVVIKVSMNHWTEFINTPFFTISCYANEAVSDLIAKLCKKIASLIPETFQRTLALKIAQGCCMYRPKPHSDHQELEAIANDENILPLQSSILYFAPVATVWQRPRLTPRGSSADVSREDLFRASQAVGASSPKTPIVINSPSWRSVRRSVQLVAKLTLKPVSKSWLLATGPPPQQSAVPRFFLTLPCPVSYEPRPTSLSGSSCASASSFREELCILTHSGLLVHVRSWTVVAALSNRTRGIHVCLRSLRLYAVCEDGSIDVHPFPQMALQQAMTRDVVAWTAADIHQWLLSLNLPSALAELEQKNMSVTSLLAMDEAKAEACFGFTPAQVTTFLAAQRRLTLLLSSAKYYLPSDKPPFPAIPIKELFCSDKIKNSWVRSFLVVSKSVPDQPHATGVELWMGTVATGRDWEDECGQVLIFSLSSEQYETSILLPHAAGCLVQVGGRIWAGGAGKITVIDVHTRQVSPPVARSLAEDPYRIMCCVTLGSAAPQDWTVWVGTETGKIFIFDHELNLLQILSEIHSGRITNIRYLEKPNLLMTASYQQGVFLWDPRTKEMLQSLPLPANSLLIASEILQEADADHAQVWQSNTDLETSLTRVYQPAPPPQDVLSPPSSICFGARRKSIDHTAEPPKPEIIPEDRSLQIEQRIQAIRERRRLSAAPPVEHSSPSS